MFEEGGGHPGWLAEQNIAPHGDFNDKEGLHSSANETINLEDHERPSGVEYDNSYQVNRKYLQHRYRLQSRPTPRVQLQPSLRLPEPIIGNFHGYDEHDKFVLTHKVWKRIGEEIQQSRKTIPSAFGCSPCNIDILINTFKAAEWSMFLLLYSLPVFTGWLPDRYLSSWTDLIRI